jgi:putative hydrolase of the HAD superfamily
MTIENHISTLFLDIGGVLFSNGWDQISRKEADKVSQFDYDEIEECYQINFDTYELGKMTLDEYLSCVIFYQKRDLSSQEFKTFMYKQSKSYPEMIAKIGEGFGLKKIYHNDYDSTVYKLKTFDLDIKADV